MIEDTPTPPEENKKSFQQHTDDVLELQQAAEASRRYQEGRAAQATANQPSEPRESGLFRKHPGLAVAGLVTIATVGVGGLVALEGGSSNGAERGTVDNSIESITLNPDANIRLDPYVGEGENNNDVLQLEAKVTIDVNHDIRVLEGTSNGTWYGIPISEVATVAPSASSINDKDGILWVNEQGVEKIETTQLPTK